PHAAALRRRLTRHAAEAGHGRLSPRAGPADHAAFAAQGHDAVDPELGQLLDHPLGTLTLHGREGHGQERFTPRLLLHAAVATYSRRVAHGFQRRSRAGVGAAPQRAGPATLAIADDDLFAGAQAQDAGEM